MVDLLLVTTVGANLATIITLIISIYSFKKEVVKYATNFQSMQQSIIEYINKIDIGFEQKGFEINNNILTDVQIRNNVAGVGK